MRPQLIRKVSFAVSTMLLVAMATGLAVLFYVNIDRAGSATDAEHRRAYARLATVAAALLCVVIVLLAAVVIRAVGRHVGQSRRHGPTQYVDAWSLAGQRIQIPDDEDGPADDEGPRDPDGGDGADDDGGGRPPDQPGRGGPAESR